MRVRSIDITKGVLIVLVVLGHVIPSSHPRLHAFLYLFHIPAFFIVSGMTHSAIDKGHLSQAIFKLSRTYLLPYLSFLILVAIFTHVFLYDIPVKSLILGGSWLNGTLGVFWFITVLYMTKVIFTVVGAFVKKRVAQIVIIGILSVVGVGSLIFINVATVPFNLFWDIQVVPLALLFFALGYYFRGAERNPFVLHVSTLITLGVSAMYFLGRLQVGFDMKLAFMFFSSVSLVILFASAMTVLLLRMSQIVEKMGMFGTLLETLGRSTLVVMYLHQLIIATITVKLPAFSQIVVFILCIIIPLLFGTIVKHSRWLSLVFLGKWVGD